jgi:hypothetical protein
MSRRWRALALVSAVGAVSGCGTFVPSIQEIPGDSAAGQALVQAIVQNVTCEVQNAVNAVIREDVEDYQSGFSQSRKTAWLDDWGIQLTLTLNIVESSSLNPVVKWTPPSPVDLVFSLGTGATVSSEATRENKLKSYYTVRELLARGPCAKDSRPGGLYMMQSDLKLREWLRFNTQLDASGQVRLPRNQKEGPFKQEVLQHEVKFAVVSSANVTPGFKLSRVDINQDGSFLSTGRTRTHDLLLTLGPVDTEIVIPRGTPGFVARGKRKNAPSAAAANSHLAAEIGLAVSNALRTAPR